MLLELIVQQNIPWRIIGKRRTPTKEIFNHMISLYEKLIDNKYEVAKQYGHIDIFRNNIENFEKQYWNMDLYVGLLADYYSKHKEKKYI